MSVIQLETTFVYGDWPDSGANVAFDADIDLYEAKPLIQTAWAQVEAFTGRTYRPITSGKAIIRVSSPIVWTWPRHPFPAALTVEVLSGGSWVAYSETYIPELGMVELEPFATYRLTQQGTVAGNTASPHVLEAVNNLALYQAIQGPARREFKAQSTGDSGFTREALMGVLYGSGAGAMLKSEVRL